MSDIREDGSELVHYDNPEFPVFCRHNFIPAGFCLRPYTPNHWHDEVELIFIEDGMIHHTINEKYITLHKGDGLFINSKQFHELITDDDNDCRLYCLIFNPSMLGSSIKTERMINAIAENENQEYVLLNEKTDWQKSIIESLIRTVELSENMEEALNIMSELYKLWNTLYANIDKEIDEKRHINQGQRLVREMIRFIQNNYRENLTLSQICEVGNVGKTKCTELFGKYVRMSPVDYLRYYRLEKSVELLKETDMSMAEIAYEVGFAGASYYGEYFKKKLGKTPLQFKKEYLEWMKEEGKDINEEISVCN